MGGCTLWLALGNSTLWPTIYTIMHESVQPQLCLSYMDLLNLYVLGWWIVCTNNIISQCFYYGIELHSVAHIIYNIWCSWYICTITSHNIIHIHNCVREYSMGILSIPHNNVMDVNNVMSHDIHYYDFFLCSFTKYCIKCHNVFYVTMVTFLITTDI